jgi:hypothetical protein
MPIPVESKATDEPVDEIAVTEIHASWSIEEIKQLLNEIEAELRKRPIPHAYRSRRAPRPHLMH